MIRATIVVLFWAVYVVGAALVGFPVTLLTRDISFLWRISMWGALAGVRLGGIRLRTVGRERLDPKQTYLYMSNHVSNLDPPIIVPLLQRRISILVKKELFRVPIFSMAMRIAEFVAVDRRNRDAAIESIRAAVQVLQSGMSMLVYPEGTRSHDGRLLPFKKGPFHMAVDAGVLIVPITMVGTHEAWPKGTFQINPGEVTACFHPPIDPRRFESREALMDAVREAIESALPKQHQMA